MLYNQFEVMEMSKTKLFSDLLKHFEETLNRKLKVEEITVLRTAFERTQGQVPRPLDLEHAQSS